MQSVRFKVVRGVRGPRRKIQHDCPSDAIEYKLKMRELERKSLKESS